MLKTLVGGMIAQRTKKDEAEVVVERRDSRQIFHNE